MKNAERGRALSVALSAWVLSGACFGISACSSSADAPASGPLGSSGSAGSGAGASGAAGSQAGDAGAGSGGISGGGSGGAAGSTQAGASGSGGGASGSGGGAGAAGCATVDVTSVPVDQQQLGGSAHDRPVFNAERIGQFITMGKAGLLAGIELSLSVPCSVIAGSLELDVYDVASDGQLGKGLLATSVVACQTGGVLAADSVGKAFFDLSSQCIAVTAAQKLRVDLLLVDVPGKCTTGQCSGGPNDGGVCTDDGPCTGVVVSAAQPSSYAGGQITFTSIGGSADENLNFKSFVAE